MSKPKKSTIELRDTPIAVISPRDGDDMNIPERFRLQFGPYEPPRVLGDQQLFCELRGRLRVSRTWSDGPIPWPRRYRTNSIILCADLVRAVKLESVEARRMKRTFAAVQARRENKGIPLPTKGGQP